MNNQKVWKGPQRNKAKVPEGEHDDAGGPTPG